MLKEIVAYQVLHDQVLSCPLLFNHSGLIDIRRGPAVGMTEQLLSRLQAYTTLTKHGCETVTKAVPSDPFLNAKHRPSRTPSQDSPEQSAGQ